MTNNLPVANPVDGLKKIMKSPTVQEQFKNALEKGSSLFVASLIDLYSGNDRLQQCDPKAVVMEALKAATLKLPINKNLGFAWVLPYNNSKQVAGKWIKVMEPAFQMGYKGYIQLSMRTGQYRFINADAVFEGELTSQDKLTGSIVLGGEATSEKIVGYFAYMETLNGFRKVVYWTVEKIHAHAKQYSPSYGNAKGRWKLDFPAMAKKTMLIELLGKYGIMSIEMETALSSDADNQYDPQDEIDENANRDFIDIKLEETGVTHNDGWEEGQQLKPGDKVNFNNAKSPATETEMSQDEKDAIVEQEAGEAEKQDDPY